MLSNKRIENGWDDGIFIRSGKNMAGYMGDNEGLLEILWH